MSTLIELARNNADVIREGVAWLAIWKNGRSWESKVFYLNTDTGLLESDDIADVEAILAADKNAVILNGYHSAHFGNWEKGSTLEDIKKGIAYHYEYNHNMLADEYRAWKRKNEIYTHNYSYAREHNEVERCRKSDDLNRVCADTLAKVISENYVDNRLQTENVVDKMYSIYGYERVELVVANWIIRFNHDGRYDKSVKEWAKSVTSRYPDDYIERNKTIILLRNHPILINAVANNIIKRELVRQSNNVESAVKKILEEKNPFYEDNIENNVNDETQNNEVNDEKEDVKNTNTEVETEMSNADKIITESHDGTHSFPEFPKSSIYGKHNIIKEFAKGVMLIATNASLRIVCVANKIASLFMSKEAIDIGDKMSDEWIGYPEEDGRASVAMFELATKNYIELNKAQIKYHIKNILSALPSYAKARELKDAMTMMDKMADESDRFYAEWSTLSKRELIDSAEQILARHDVIDYFSSPELELPMEGVFLCNPDLVEDTISYLIDNKLTTNDIEQYVNAVVEAHSNEETAAEQPESEMIEAQLNRFVAELETSAPIVINSVDMQFVCNGISKNITLSIDDFMSYIPQEALDSFAAQKMSDFPCKDYFGKKGELLYQAVTVKRFCEDVINNYNYFAPKTETTYMIVNKLSKEPAPSSSMDKLICSTVIHDYAKACCRDTQKIDNALNNNLVDLKQTISKINSMVDSYQTNITEEVKELTEEEITTPEPEKQLLDDIMLESIEL